MACIRHNRYGAGVKPFSVIYKDAVHHGVVIGVSLPQEREPIPDAILQQLHPEERAYAQDLQGHRQRHWVGGRLAAQIAFTILGAGSPPVLTDPWGAPTCRSGLNISITHKRHMAVALVAREEHGCIGVDLEDLSPARPRVAERVLRPEALEAIQQLPEERRWTGILLRFSIKEAIYKALAPKLRRYIDFSEASVSPRIDGTADVQLHLREPLQPRTIEARYLWLRRSVLSTVRVCWRAPEGDS